MNVLVIGAGNMGSTFGHSFVNANALSPSQLFFLDHSAEKASAISSLSTSPLALQPGAFVTNMDLVILSVKPQDFSVLASRLKPFIHPEQLILSIMAGVTVENICHVLGVSKVVRAMPNLPAQVGQGMTVFTTSAEVSRLEIFTVQNLLNTTGKTLYTPHEPMLDAATAISGSGPAFVYFFMSAMMESARNMGFSDSEAQLLVEQTFIGSVNLLHRNAIHCDEWIRKVSSRGGTTEAALKGFQEEGIRSGISKGLELARKRAIELSGANT
ncbi:MAG: pyrroline-5-carboxylate reductase [Bacteroidota bacterium]